MIINKCDICGMTEGLRYLDEKDNKCIVTFSSRPMTVQKKNYRGEDYNVYINVIIEKCSDAQKINDMYSKMNGETDVMTALMQQILGGGGGMGGKMVKLDNPHPSICDACRKKIMLAQLVG